MEKLSSESVIQSHYLTWLKLQYPIARKVTSSFPNSGVRDPRYGARLKREGMTKGFPDLGVFFPSGGFHGLFIEFKTAKGRLSPEQKEVMANLEAQGYKCVVCKSLQEGIDATKDYFSSKSSLCS